jgi:lipid II isoglutaminyl synthase (glutamine-hydrolysing)
MNNNAYPTPNVDVTVAAPQSPYTLRLAHLYAGHMNLYGDRGNVLALYRRAQWRGIKLDIVTVDPGAPPADLAEFDLYFMGGGQDTQQLAIEADLHQHKAPALTHAAQAGAVFLTICGGYQLLGHSYKPHDGPTLKGLGLVDAHTVAGQRRMIGNVAITRPDGQTVVGFENHSGQTFLGPKATALGNVITGGGNNGQDGLEGVCQGNLYGTYLHGSLLPKNPALTDELLQKALNYRYGSAYVLPELMMADTAELAAHAMALTLTA